MRAGGVQVMTNYSTRRPSRCAGIAFAIAVTIGASLVAVAAAWLIAGLIVGW